MRVVESRKTGPGDSRAKEHRFVVETEKIYKVIKIAAIALVLIVLGYAIYQWESKASAEREIRRAEDKRARTVAEEARKKAPAVPESTRAKTSKTITVPPCGIDSFGKPICSEEIEVTGKFDFNFYPAEGEIGGCINLILNDTKYKVCQGEKLPFGRLVNGSPVSRIKFCSLENRPIKMALDIYQ